MAWEKTLYTDGPGSGVTEPYLEGDGTSRVYHI